MTPEKGNILFRRKRLKVQSTNAILPAIIIIKLAVLLIRRDIPFRLFIVFLGLAKFERIESSSKKLTY
jgi:hypothetical protein